MISDIYSLMRDQVNQNPEAPVIRAPGRETLTYGALESELRYTALLLSEMGIGLNDCVGIVLPNGPEMALAFLGVACCATCAPLNPAYQLAEYEFYLSDLEAKGVVTMAGWDSPVRDAARSRGIPIIEIVPECNGPAGVFRLPGAPSGESGFSCSPGPDDIALVLHTSGTTARPKIVPLSHQNLCASAHNVGNTLKLTSDDVCLNVMPLFHIHGLVGALLSSLSRGASVICSPGFFAPNFYQWVDEMNPTWYTAVPTIHQAILSRAGENLDIIRSNPLRFIRSSSASLPPKVMADLEEVFNAPVIEAYGMTEAAHQMTCNPLPPYPRKPGSVGPAAGPEVAIMDETRSELLSLGKVGEIVIRGINVMGGYVNRPEANDKAFAQGWFRTGDQGYLDEKGYLYITGRIKELINRGGEKISPREVDEVLLDHPAVLQAVTFAMPDPTMGEEVAAAVVVSDNGVTEQALRQFVAGRLAYFKVPRRIVMVDEIPKGPTGKLQRIGLAERLGVGTVEEETEQVPFQAPRTQLEEILAMLWKEVLQVPEVGVHHRFLNLGGDSIMAAQLVARVRQRFQVELSLIDFMDLPTVAEQAPLVEKLLIDQIKMMSDEEVDATLT